MFSDNLGYNLIQSNKSLTAGPIMYCFTGNIFTKGFKGSFKGFSQEHLHLPQPKQLILLLV